jgi:hypothetical protein
MMIAFRSLSLPNEDFGRSKNDEIRISKEALFKGVSTGFGLLIVEKSVENPDFIVCSSFQNLRLGRDKLRHAKAAVELTR